MKDFILKIEYTIISVSAALVSMDVAVLYSNILHEEARMVVQDTFEWRPMKNPPIYF